MNANLQTAFCQTCNARDRVIQHGRCVVCGNPPDAKPSYDDLARSLEQVRSSYTFLANDQAPMERRYHEARAEVDALRQLVTDFIEYAVPALSKMNSADMDESSWQYRAKRAMAHCPIAEPASR